MALSTNIEAVSFSSLPLSGRCYKAASEAAHLRCCPGLLLPCYSLGWCDARHSARSSSQRNLEGETRTSELGELNAVLGLVCINLGEFLHTEDRGGLVWMKLERDRLWLLTGMVSGYRLRTLQRTALHVYILISVEE